MKKSILLLTICLATASAKAFAQAASYAGGDGSKDAPYLISNADELAKLAQDVNQEANFSRGRYFKLTQDIVINEGVNATALTVLQGGKAFPQTAMIGNYIGENDYKAFQGVFDGDGHTISGFYSVPNANYIGLFRVLDGATVKNLGLKDCFVYSGAYLSCLAGLVKNSRIINCYIVDSKIVGWGSNSGPLAGQVFGNSKLQNCYTAISMSTKNDTGGILGRIGNGTEEQVVVENCFTTTTITTTKSNKAGVTATSAVGSTVRHCYYTSGAGKYAVWPSQDKGTTEDCQLMTAEEMATNDFVSLLNRNAADIPGATRWQKGAMTPIHNYAEVTPEGDDERDISAIATDPVPADGDTHADMDGDSQLLSWTAARDGKTVRQYLYLGTDSATIAQAATSEAVATLGTETSHAISGMSNLLTYYWRVDREDAEGKLTQGDVWSFQPRHLAFPGAEGYGRFARGGRGGKVVYVTSLGDDDTEGTLRWALTNGSGPRTVLFRVSGIIDMNYKTCWVDDQVTIAAQTAPGKGICIKHADIGIGSDNIVRFLRARRGLGTSAQTGNAIGTVYADHTILDHVTASWGTDETFSSRGSKNITLQRSIISEALGIAGHRNYDAGTNHGYAATIGGDIGSFHHNLLADCNGRNWSMGGGTDANGAYAGRLDIYNNVVYNWHGRTTDGGAHEVNFVSNYYKMGPASQLKTLFTLEIEGNLKGTQSAYIKGNIRDNLNGTLSEDKEGDTYRLNIRDGRTSLSWQPFVSQPFFHSHESTESAIEAYKNVLSDTGANQPAIDQTDQRMVTETLNRSYTYVGSKSGIKGEIDNEQDAGGFEDYPEEQRPADYDTDSDGLPNWWEEIRGTDAHAHTHDFAEANSDLEGDGYTELERYLDFMAQPHVLLAPGGTATIDLKSLFAGYTNNPAFTAESNSTAVTATLAGGTLTVKGGDKNTLATIKLTVTDADQDCYTRRLCIAVTSNTTAMGIDNLPVIPSADTDASLYDLTGRRIQIPTRNGIYVEKGRKVSVRTR